MHAVTEAYLGANIAKESGVSTPQAVIGTNNPVYDQAHKNATPQSGEIYASFVDSRGNILSTSTRAHHLSVYVYKPATNTTPADALEINAIPIPTSTTGN